MLRFYLYNDAFGLWNLISQPIGSGIMFLLNCVWKGVDFERKHLERFFVISFLSVFIHEYNYSRNSRKKESDIEIWIHQNETKKQLAYAYMKGSYSVI
jgi:hypothetical protein